LKSHMVCNRSDWTAYEPVFQRGIRIEVGQRHTIRFLVGDAFQQTPVVWLKCGGHSILLMTCRPATGQAGRFARTKSAIFCCSTAIREYSGEIGMPEPSPKHDIAYLMPAIHNGLDRSNFSRM